MKYKGTHIFVDFDNFKHDNGTEYMGNQIYKIMSTAIETQSNMKIVHKHLEILKDPETADGFTSVLLLDESHFTAHAYTDEHKLLALDLFTCGKTDTAIIMDYVINEIKLVFPNIKLNNFVVNKRFKYN